MTLFAPELIRSAQVLLQGLAEREMQLVTVESCTGGLLSGLLTEVPGSSLVVDRGFVTYSNDAKSELVGVDPVLLMAHGAVSAQVAAAMAEGALERCDADIAIAVTGIAGPDGGTEKKPVGLVHFAAARRGAETISSERSFGDIGRQEVRLAAVAEALILVRSQMDTA